jgi:hypothetical protein
MSAARALKARVRNSADRCKHEHIYEIRTFPSGNVDGRCFGCGDETFPIRDVDFEEWMASDDAPRCCFGSRSALSEPETKR